MDFITDIDASITSRHNDNVSQQIRDIGRREIDANFNGFHPNRPAVNVDDIPYGFIGKHNMHKVMPYMPDTNRGQNSNRGSQIEPQQINTALYLRGMYQKNEGSQLLDTKEGWA